MHFNLRFALKAIDKLEKDNIKKEKQQLKCISWIDVNLIIRMFNSK